MSWTASWYGFQSVALFVARCGVTVFSYISWTRGALFYACRKYLLRNLYHDLQDLSAKASSDAGDPVIVFDAGETELEALPTSATSPSTPTIGRKRPFHSALSRALFSLCFTETCILFLLLVCQAIDVLHPRVRLAHWQISLSVLLAAIVLVIPLSYSLVLSNGSGPPGVSPTRQQILSPSLVLYLIPNVVFLLALSYVPLPKDMPTHTVFASTLSRLTVIGTVLLGLLSGFGAIYTAWDFFPVFSRNAKSPPTDEEVRSAEAGLQRVREDLAQRQNDLQALEATKQPEAQSSWLSRTLPSWQGNSEMNSMAQEVTGLQALEREMSRNLEVLKQYQGDAKFSRTLAGQAFTWGGRLFAVYCIYRIFASLVNLLLPRTPSSTPGAPATTNADVVSFVLAYLFSYLPFIHLPQAKIAVISRQISLGLVGAIILSSIRRVLRGVARILRVTSRSLGASLMLLILAQVMGIYLLSTLIQLRTSFPPPPSRPDVDPDLDAGNLFSTLPEWQFFGSLFDGAFLLAAAVSAAVRWLGDRVTG
ncbi:Abscisic acid G-protein coupled receptor-domain-containing protein [Trametes gibbosa]|nr:Abscisic acid G-protein coupled receptor-domain-containing protein [Trametes gibbosa]